MLKALTFSIALVSFAGTALAQDALGPFIPIDLDTYNEGAALAPQTDASGTVDIEDTANTDATEAPDYSRFYEGLNPFVEISIK